MDQHAQPGDGHAGEQHHQLVVQCVRDQATILPIREQVWPRLQFKRIHYIKKTKDDTVDIEQNVEVLAKRMQLSTREIRDYLNM